MVEWNGNSPILKLAIKKRIRGDFNASKGVIFYVESKYKSFRVVGILASIVWQISRLKLLKYI